MPIFIGIFYLYAIQTSQHRFNIIKKSQTKTNTPPFIPKQHSKASTRVTFPQRRK